LLTPSFFPQFPTFNRVVVCGVTSVTYVCKAAVAYILAALVAIKVCPYGFAVNVFYGWLFGTFLFGHHSSNSPTQTYSGSVTVPTFTVSQVSLHPISIMTAIANADRVARTWLSVTSHRPGHCPKLKRYAFRQTHRQLPS
jgi:hypothetical protein